MNASPNEPSPRRRRPVRWLLRQVEHGLAVIGLGTLVYFLCFDLSRVVSDSMAPTLRGGGRKDADIVLTERVSFRFRQPRRWEVIMIRDERGVRVLKRVVGLPGERVQMLRNGQVIIDGEPIPRPEELEHLEYFPFGNLTADKPPVECGDGYFVLGDFSRDSSDSRFNGPVKPEDVLGRAWLIVAPGGRRGFINF